MHVQKGVLSVPLHAVAVSPSAATVLLGDTPHRDTNGGYFPQESLPGTCEED